MKFKEKYTLLGLIDEFHWDGTDKEHLYVFVNHYNMPDFMKFFDDQSISLFDDEGIECYWKGSYICIPNFEDVLDYIGLSEEEIHEMFEEE